MLEIICEISGRVQGVGYRDYVSHAAQECSVLGYAKNQSNGSVLVCGQGKQSDLKNFIEYLHEGSVVAVVDKVSVRWNSVEAEYDDFSISR